MVILNLTKEKIIAANARYATTFRERLLGMIGKDFSTFDAMVFDHCNAIHTFFMKRPLDILFVSDKYEILKTVQNFPPWKPFLYCKNAFYVIELAPGTIAGSDSTEKDLLDLAGALSPETEKKWISGRKMFQAADGNAVSMKTKD